MKKSKSLIAMAFFITPAVFANPWMADHGPVAATEPCYQETVRAQQQAADLSTAPCSRALRSRLSREDRSTTHHNRGTIAWSMGEKEAALADFKRSVALSGTVDQRNLALAQAAHQLGDYELAIEQYDLLLTGDTSPPAVAKRRDQIARNRARAELARTRVSQL